MWNLITRLAIKAARQASKTMSAAERQAIKEIPRTRRIGYRPGTIGNEIYGVKDVEVLNKDLLNLPLRAGDWINEAELPSLLNNAKTPLEPALKFGGKIFVVNPAHEPVESMDDVLLNAIFK